MTVAVLPFNESINMLQNNMTAEAYTNIDEYPDFSLDMYVADLMTNPIKDDPAYERLSFYVEEADSINTEIFKLLRDDKSFRNSLKAWETMNAIFDPSAETAKCLDEEGYYEAIILNALNSAFKSQDYNAAYAEQAYKTVNSLYSYFKNNSELVYYIQNYDKLTSNEVTNFGKALSKAYEKEVSDIADFSDFMKNINTIYKICKTANEFIEKTVSYYYCNKMTDEMKNLVHILYNNCDGKANPGMKLALSNIVTACDSYTLSIVEAFSDTAFTAGVQAFAKVTDKYMKSCIAYFPAGKAILLTQAITKSAVNFILSTDKIREQYYKMERLYNFEMLIRSTLKSQMKGYQVSPSESNAKLLFAALDVFFKTYDIGGEYVNDYANLMFKENIVGRIFNNTATYNQLTSDIRKCRSYAQETKEYLKNTHYLYTLEDEYPEIYEAYKAQLSSVSAPKEIKVLGVDFNKDEIELGLEDYFAELNADLQPIDATNRQIIYTSSNTNVADCSYGAVYPRSIGTAVITATTVEGGFTDTIVVNVVEGHGKDGFYFEPTQIVTAKVGDTFESGGLKYKVTSDNEVELTGYTSEPTGALYIPSTVGYGGKMFNVTSIGKSAFYSSYYSCKKLTSIIIPNSVETIGDNAFNSCNTLTSVIIPNSVETIGECAFWDCSGLTNIIIPNSVKTIDFCAFQCCSGLTSIVIPNSVETIGDCAISNCPGLKEITIGSNVTSFGSTVFLGCSNVKKLIFADGITAINSNMIYGMESSLEEVVIPDSVTYIGSSTFANCTKITKINLPPNLETIEKGTFDYCKNLTNIIIPNSVKTIDRYAFECCSGLTSIVIPNRVETIGDNAFGYCTGLKEITIGNSITEFSSNAFGGCNNIKKLVFSDGITAINSNMTNNMESSLEEVIIPDSVTYIGSYTFSGCSKLTHIDLPPNITEIESGTFEGCTGLKNIVIPDGVTEIRGGSNTTYDGAFRGCSGLTSIVIPDSVKTVGHYAFYDCTGLKEITIGSSVTSCRSTAFSACSNVKKLVFADGISSINSDMTSNLEASLEEVIIPDSVTYIGSYTFSGCSKLTHIDLPPNITEIESGTFEGCTGLKNIVIPDGVTEIRGGSNTTYDGAFRGCSGLTSIVIPDSVETIGNYAFYECSGLTDVYYMGSESEWNKISISSRGNEYLTSATIHFNFTPPQGDVNMDGSFNVADVVLLQKWLLAVPDVKLAYWKSADLCKDDRLNVFDLCLMKRMLIEQNNKNS